MKKSRVIFLLFILLVLPLSCTQSEVTELRFDQEINLTGKTIPVTDSIYFRYPFRIRKKDSLLYILDLHGPDFYCHTLSYPAMTLTTSLARTGNGPEEFLSVMNIRSDQDGAIYLLDANKKAISVYNPENYSLFRRINLSDNLMRSLDFTLINDSLFAIPDYTGACRINIVDSRGNIQKRLFNIPTKKRKDPDRSDIVLAQAWRSFVDYNPENGILAMATQLGQVIEIYNLKTNEIINILYGKSGEPEYVDQGAYAVPNGIMGYSDVQVGRDRIYTLFWGTSFKDIRKNPLHRMEGGNILQIFNLNGEPIIQYILDRYITGFTIDETNNRLLGLDVNNNQPVVEYQFLP